MNPIDRVRAGDINYFKTAEVQDFINYRDGDDRSVLYMAVRCGRFDLCEAIGERCPELLYQPNTSLKYTVLLYAVGLKRTDIVKLFIGMGGKRLLRMADISGVTPMHLAASNHTLDLVNLLFEADPDYIYPPNINGVTPLCVLLHPSTPWSSEDTVRIARLLLGKDSNRIKQRLFRTESTLLHYVAELGEISFAQYIISLCPESVQLVDSQGCNFLHIAAQCGNVEFVKQASAMKETTADILNMQDKKGNTPLQLAVQARKNDVALCLLYDERVIKTSKNAEGITALEEITFEYDKNKAIGMTEKELELCIAPEQVELYRGLVEKFGDIVQQNLPKYKIGPISQALTSFLTVIDEMLAATPDIISEQKLAEWESMSSYYTSVGLQIGWFSTLVLRFTEWFSNQDSVVDRLKSDFARENEAVEAIRQKLAVMEAALQGIKDKLETAQTGGFDFNVLDILL